MTRAEFMVRMLGATTTPRWFSPLEHKRHRVDVSLHLDGRQIARAVHRHAKEAK